MLGIEADVQMPHIVKADYLGVYPQPEIIASDLVEAASQIVEG